MNKPLPVFAKAVVLIFLGEMILLFILIAGFLTAEIPTSSALRSVGSTLLVAMLPFALLMCLLSHLWKGHTLAWRILVAFIAITSWQCLNFVMEFGPLGFPPWTIMLTIHVALLGSMLTKQIRYLWLRKQPN